ncbi:E3 ubiquitin-protein ligase MARCH7-like isoform X1 [Xiphophorus couchianus]|uniref:E3 ubiquitin-protein ligase MARCH7-like isoform X1 n=1 Tax=Xiphophorus couchianus TaxID=32473 RepID=UPI001015E004|nr:E3 ubiquitin-protein ligase MARCH7-like isoform X1 [Xiphophorus couchianus]
MFNKLWKRIRQWLSFNTSEDSPLPESAREQSQWTTATDEAAQSPESLKNDAACDHKESSTSGDIAHDNEDNQCRICYGDHSDADPLLSPCQCSGSLTYIHCSCLRTWIRTRLQSGSTLGAATRCEICTKTFYSVDNNQQESEQNDFEELIFEVEHLMSELELLSTALFMNKVLWLSPMVYTTYFNRIGSPLRTIGWEVILNVRPHTPDT